MNASDVLNYDESHPSSKTSVGNAETGNTKNPLSENLAIVPVAGKQSSANGSVIEFSKSAQLSPLETSNVKITIGESLTPDSESGTFSIKDVNSTTNLLALDSNPDFFKKLHTHQQQSNHHVITNNLLRPIEKTNLNNSSQSSIDTRLKFGDDIDMIPLMPMNSKLDYFR
jgi:hypothetical protein